MNVRTRYHLDQRYAAAVEVNNCALALIVQQLACVFLKVNALKANALRLAVYFKINIAVFANRHIEL